MGRIKPPVQSRRAGEEMSASESVPEEALAPKPVQQPEADVAVDDIGLVEAVAKQEAPVTKAESGEQSQAIERGQEQAAKQSQGPIAAATNTQPASGGISVFRPQLAFKPNPPVAAPAAQRPPPTSNFAILNAGPAKSNAQIAVSEASEQPTGAARPPTKPSLTAAAGVLPQPLRIERLRDSAAAASASDSITESGTAGDDNGGNAEAGDPEWVSRRVKSKALNRPERYTPVIPAPPLGERRANRLWRTHLNGVLLRTAMQNIKRKVGHSKTLPFLTQVDLTVAPDYHEFVKQEEEMWLHLIANKLRSLSYSDAASFLRDFEAIQRNCAAYNVPGAGKFGGPALVELSQELLEACKQELIANAEDLRKAEDAIQNPECQPPQNETAGERAVSSAAVQKAVPTGPLPPGFKHVLRMTSSKPSGWIQYEAMCPVHNSIRTADRISKLVEIFRIHANCREEWKQYQQQIDEPATTYQDRLRGTFSFQRTNASPGSDSQHNQHPASDSVAAASEAPAGPSSASQHTTRPSVSAQQAHAARPVDLPPSYQTAFKLQNPPAKPPFPPPSGRVTWPSRSSSPSGSGAARKRKADAAASAAAERSSAASQDAERPAKKAANESARATANGAESEPALSHQNLSAEAAADQAVLDARRRLQLEMERYRQEVAKHPLSPGAPGEGPGPGSQDPSVTNGRQRRDVDMLPQAAGGAHVLASLIPGFASPSQPASASAGVMGVVSPTGVTGSRLARTSSPGSAIQANGRLPQPEPAWDGEGYFPRPREQAYLRYKLGCSSPSSILLLVGPPGSGKSCLLEQMRTAWIEEEKKRLAAAAEPSKHLEAPWLQFDCRTACTSSSHFAATLKAAIAESAHKAAEAGRTLPLIRNRDHNSYVKPQEWTPAVAGEEDLSQCLASLAKWWEDLRKAGRRVTCLVFDTAHKLRETPWGRQLLDALEEFTRHGVHVVLASSESTFRSWLAEVGTSVEAETVGNLPPAAARRFFEGLLKKQPAPLSLEADWPEILRVVGGNPSLLRRCLQSAACYDSLEAGLKSIWQEAGARVRQGLEGSQQAQAHTKEQYSTAVGAILDSSYRAVSATELENRLGPEGGKAVRSLAKTGLLMLREPSHLAADIPAAAYGPLQDRLVTLPSAAHAYFWSLLSKASADALSCGPY